MTGARRSTAAPVTIETPDDRYGPLTLALRGEHQVGNALVAVRLLEAARRRGIARAERRDRARTDATSTGPGGSSSIRFAGRRAGAARRRAQRGRRAGAGGVPAQLASGAAGARHRRHARQGRRGHPRGAAAGGVVGGRDGRRPRRARFRRATLPRASSATGRARSRCASSRIRRPRSSRRWRAAAPSASPARSSSSARFATRSDAVLSCANPCHFLMVSSRILFLLALCVYAAPCRRAGTRRPQRRHAVPADNSPLAQITQNTQSRLECPSADHCRLTGQVDIEIARRNEILRRRDRHLTASRRCDRRVRQRRVQRTRRDGSPRSGSSSTSPTAPGRSTRRPASCRSATPSTRAVRQSGSGRLLLRRHDREGRPAIVPADARRLHHLRAADAALGGRPATRWSINLNDYAVARNMLLRVKGVPLMYLPIIYYPIKDEDRATGFLLPTYGSSTLRGQAISNAFFWAIGRSQDATFFHDWFTRTGQGAGAEYRYVAGQGSYGNFRFYHLDQHEAEFAQIGCDDDPAGAVELPVQRRRQPGARAPPCACTSASTTHRTSSRSSCTSRTSTRRPTRRARSKRGAIAVRGAASRRARCSSASRRSPTPTRRSCMAVPRASRRRSRRSACSGCRSTAR